MVGPDAGYNKFNSVNLLDSMVPTGRARSTEARLGLKTLPLIKTPSQLPLLELAG